MNPPVVGLMGKKRSGKDTFADMLVNEGFLKVAFADALREWLLLLNPWIVDEEIDPTRYGDLVADVGYEASKTYPEVRRLLQVFGTDVVRNALGADTWINLLDRRLKGIGTPIVISDVRFPNEAEFIHDRGGVLVRINRFDPFFGDPDTHASETSVDGFAADYTIWNNHDLASLACDAHALAEILKGRPGDLA